MIPYTWEWLVVEKSKAGALSMGLLKWGILWKERNKNRCQTLFCLSRPDFVSASPELRVACGEHTKGQDATRWYCLSCGAQCLPPCPCGNGKEPKLAEVQVADNWKHREVGMRCGSCMWFVRKVASNSAEKSTLGRCRRHAPTMAGFPAVFETDWCGDHKLDEEKL